MKTHLFYFLFGFLFPFCFLNLSYAFNYYITFSGSGAGTTVDSVKVQNLYTGAQITVPAGMQLRLYDVENAVSEINTIAEYANVYPNPTTSDATFSFLTSEGGNSQITVYSFDGRKIAGWYETIQQGRNSFRLALPVGVYLVEAKGKQFSYTCRTVSLSNAAITPEIGFISHNGNAQKVQQSEVAEVKLQYNQGDLLFFKAYSGKYCTALSDKPVESKNIDIKFVVCTDTENNHYTVVKIGNQTWMAENLKTTKYRNGDAIGTTTPANKDIFGENAPKYHWAYNGEETNAAKYGRLYTWHAVADSRNIAPEGWHVATDADWVEMQNYLIQNGYNYDGSLTDNLIAKSLAANNGWTYFSVPGRIGNDLSKNNKSGFTALPGGWRDYVGTSYSIGLYGNWWSSTAFDNDNAWFYILGYDYMNLYRGYVDKLYGCSVRCVKD